MPVSDLRKRRAEAAAKAAKREAKATLAAGAPNIDAFYARLNLDAARDGNELVFMITQIRDLRTSRLDLQSRKKKYQQLADAYAAYSKFTELDPAERVNAVLAMTKELEHWDRTDPQASRPGRTKKLDPVASILKLMLAYSAESPNDRATLSKDKALLDFAAKEKIPATGFLEALPELRRKQALQKGMAARRVSPEGRDPNATQTVHHQTDQQAEAVDDEVSDPGRDTPEELVPTKRIKGTQKVSKPGVYLAVLRSDGNGKLRICLTERAYGSLNDFDKLSKAELKSRFRDCTQAFRHLSRLH